MARTTASVVILGSHASYDHDGECIYFLHFLTRWLILMNTGISKRATNAGQTQVSTTDRHKDASEAEAHKRHEVVHAMRLE